MRKSCVTSASSPKRNTRWSALMPVSPSPRPKPNVFGPSRSRSTSAGISCGSAGPGVTRVRTPNKHRPGPKTSSRRSTSGEDRGRMLVIDASCLFEVVADTQRAEGIRRRLAADTDHAAPHLVDAEVLGVIRRQFLVGTLDHTAAAQAVDDLR